MKVFSETTNRSYETEDAVFYKNPWQASFMMSHSECILLDIFELDGKLTYVFPKEQHRAWFDDWVKRSREHREELNKK